MQKKQTAHNPAAENIRLFEKSRELKRIVAVNERRTIRDRMKWFWMFVLFLVLPGLISWSILTESTFLYTNFMQMTGQLAWSFGLTALLVMLIEGIKLAGGMLYIRFFTQGYLFDGWHYILFFCFLNPFVVGSYVGSIYLSVNGAPEISRNISRLHKQPEKIDIDSIQLYYDKKLDILQVDKTAAMDIKWAGTTTRNATALSKEIQEQINQLENEKSKTIALARKENEFYKYEYSSDVEQWGEWLQGFGGIGEVFQIFILILIGVYERAGYLELPEAEKDDNPSAPPEGAGTPGSTQNKDKNRPQNRPKKTTQNRPQNRQKMTSKTVREDRLPEGVISIKKDNTKSAEPRSGQGTKLVVGRIFYDGKWFSEKAFKDKMSKAKNRSINNATKTGRNRQKLLYEDLLKTWNKYYEMLKKEGVA